MPLAPAIAATTYKLQGTTCKGVLLFSLNEPGRQRTSLYVAASRVTTLKGLFLCEKLTEDDFENFRPSQSVLREEERLDMLCKKTLLHFKAGKLIPQVVNKDNDGKQSSKRHRMQENEREKIPSKKPSRQSAKSSEYDANSEKQRLRKIIYEKE